MKATLTFRGFQTKSFQRSASMGRGQVSVAVTTVRSNGSSLLLCQDLSQCWLGKIWKAFSSKSDASHCGVDSTILPLCWFSLVRRIVSMLCAFYRCFFGKFIRVVFYFSWLRRFNWHSLFCTVASLKVFTMNVSDADTRVLNTETFPQQTITDLFILSIYLNNYLT